MIWDNSRLNIKGKLNSTVFDNDYQHYYRANYSNCVGWNKYRNIWKDIATELMEEVIITGYEWKLPCGLGTIRMKKYKPKLRFKEGRLDPKILHIDYNETRILWENDLDAREKKIKVYHLNSHSDGYKVVLDWLKPFTKTSKVRKFRFYPTRILESKVSEVLKKHLNKTDYFNTMYIPKKLV